MVDEKKVKAAVEFFMHNEFWKKVYEEAPSDKCRESYALTFYASTFIDDAREDEDFFKKRDDVEDQLDLEDWKYLYKYQGNNPGKLKIKNKIKELGGSVG